MDFLFSQVSMLHKHSCRVEELLLVKDGEKKEVRTNVFIHGGKEKIT